MAPRRHTRRLVPARRSSNRETPSRYPPPPISSTEWRWHNAADNNTVDMAVALPHIHQFTKIFSIKTRVAAPRVQRFWARRWRMCFVYVHFSSTMGNLSVLACKIKHVLIYLTVL